VRIFSRPPRFSGVEFGGALYHDVIAANGNARRSGMDRSANVALTRETPEVIAEFSNLRHTYFGIAYDSQAYYVQLACRLKPQPKLKPVRTVREGHYGAGRADHRRVVELEGDRWRPVRSDRFRRPQIEFARRSPSLRNGLYAQAAVTF